jgi:ubiquinone/menaquinone biosynthesis C-methylase UbiE
MIHNENIVGNTYDKYTTRNPVARYLMRNFLDSVTSLYNEIRPTSVLEIGCGEGRLIQHLVSNAILEPQEITASDVSLDHLSNNLNSKIKFIEGSIYELPFENGQYDLVVCCEVMEHLEKPANGLAEISRIADKAVLISTPWEPVWRIMNLMRGKYITNLGNTPGHIQHFSRSGLIEFAQTQLDVIATRTPLPWTVILGKPR